MFYQTIPKCIEEVIILSFFLSFSLSLFLPFFLVFLSLSICLSLPLSTSFFPHLSIYISLFFPFPLYLFKRFQRSLRRKFRSVRSLEMVLVKLFLFRYQQNNFATVLTSFVASLWPVPSNKTDKDVQGGTYIDQDQIQRYKCEALLQYWNVLKFVSSKVVSHPLVRIDIFVIGTTFLTLKPSCHLLFTHPFTAKCLLMNCGWDENINFETALKNCIWQFSFSMIN